MNKTELLDHVSGQLEDMTKKDVERVLNTFYTSIPKVLAGDKDEKVQIMGFGTYKASFVKGRQGVNPKNPEEEVEIPDGYRIHFSAGQNFKDVVNGKTKDAKKGSSKKSAKKASDKKASKGKAAAAPAKATGKKKKKK